MTEKDNETWNCGHVISHKNKGPTDESNLRPICPHCNRKMNSRNWDEWENEQINKLINNEYFRIFQKIKCCNEDCENKITMKTYKAQKYEDNTAKPWCKKCYNTFNNIKDIEIDEEEYNKKQEIKDIKKKDVDDITDKLKNIDVKNKKKNVKLNCIVKVKKPKQITISNA
jgi:hypothetical protein